jgi:hypothetical protein
VLRITWQAGAGPARTLRLEGRLLAPWVPEVAGACARRAGEGRPLRLDLSAVSFADEAGARCLRDLLGQGVEVVACSPFLATLLHLEAM